MSPLLKLNGRQVKYPLYPSKTNKNIKKFKILGSPRDAPLILLIKEINK